jgi:two-component system, LytTR family, response regulator
MATDVKVLLVDDEAPARAKLRRMLSAEPGIVIVGEASSWAEAVAAIGDRAPDLVLLDIQMPGKTGFDVIEEVGPEAMPHVIFVTAYDQYALEAFEVRALDYLLKPVALERLREALDRVRERLTSNGSRAIELQKAIEALAPPKFLRRVLVEDGDRSVLLPLDRVDRIEADRNYVWLHADGRAYPLRAPMTSIEDRLDPQRFLRINRSAIVRMDAIVEMQPWSHGDFRVVMRDGTALMWSRRYRAKARGEFGVED